MNGVAGHLSLEAEARSDGRTILGRQSFRAPFHVGKPYWDGRVLLIQVVNPTAGILAGDTLESDVRVGPGAAVLLTSPSATRVFRMERGQARSRQAVSIGPGGWLEFWGEPLVPHGSSSFWQRTTIDVGTDGELVHCEYLMPGRLAHGEAWNWSRLVLELSVRVGDAWVLRERVDQSGSELQAVARWAGMGASAAFANMVLVSPRLADEQAWRPAVSELHGHGVWLGVSRLRGAAPAFSVKIIAPDADALRRTHAQVRWILAERLPQLRADPRKL